MDFILNKDFKPEKFDPNLPFWFCDVDGVLNALPYDQKWVGPDKPNDWELFEQKNWEFYRIEPNTETHFPLDSQAVVEYNKNHIFYDFDPKYVPTKLIYSTELINRIQNVISSGKVNFVWLTSWSTEATRLLNPLFGFPENIPHLSWPTGGDAGQMNKVLGIYDLYEMVLSKLDNRKGFIWTDDVATRGYVTFGPEKSSSYWENHKPHIPDEKLVIKVTPEWGISREEMAEIESFLKIEQQD